ncbi:MAG: acyl-CoA dehydrogenase family protein, partial [Stellaceae bacterium]
MSSPPRDRRRADPEPVDYPARARALAPTLAAAADEIEHSRELPPHIVEALLAGGFFRLVLPRALGGAELPPLVYVQVLEEIAKAEP